MENVINLGIPHVSEHIFESFDAPGLINCMEVSQTWKVLAENVLIKRWKGKMIEACKCGETKVVQVLLERCNSEESGLNARNEKGSTAFMAACQYGHKDVVYLLLDHSERVECKKQQWNDCVYVGLLIRTHKCCPIASQSF